MIFHLTLVAQPYLETHTVGDTWWWITDSPLRIATAGTQAVLVFFALSGLVVALPALRQGFSWRKYFASRFLRLYIPAWAALAFAAVLIFFIPRPSSGAVAGSWLATTNAQSTPIGTLLADASLMKVGNAADNVLWSLRWEIFFSLLLPLFVIVAKLVGRYWLVGIAVCVAITATGQGSHTDPRMYLPVFMIGTLMAAHVDEIVAWSALRRTRFWVAALLTSFACIIAYQAFDFLVPTHTILGHILWSLVALGSAGVIFCAMGSPAVRGFLNARVTQFFGRNSFSLYLVHVPIIATLAFFLGEQLWWMVAIVGIPLSIGVAVLFRLAVEGPSQRLARAIGVRVSGARRAASVARPQTAAAMGEGSTRHERELARARS